MAHSRQNKSRPSLIPAELRDAAAAQFAEEQARESAFREQVERDQRCADAVKAFRDATGALWSAPSNEARSKLPAVHTALLGACAAMAEAGRLASWEQIDHEKAYDSCRVRNHRAMSRHSYEWACELLGKARGGQLSEGLLAETWEAEGLRHAFRWLSIFVHGLSGEGAVLPKVQGQAPSKPEGRLTANEAQTPLTKEPIRSHVMVDLARKTITLDGTQHDVSSDNALRWVRVLVEHPSEWISSAQLKKYDSELQSTRTDRWRKHLPEAVSSLIESDTGKGSRIRLKAQQGRN